MGIQNLTGQTFGQYELQALIGLGGMGAVYRAHQANLQRTVAVKVLAPVLATERGYAERFTREARTAASLEHPHIVPVYDYGTEEALSYVVMRLLTGGTLMQRIDQAVVEESFPPLDEIVTLLNQVADALDYAHHKGVIHRDIKPSNIMFDDHGHAFLVDFGIAKLMQETSSLTGTGVSMGTPSYMAPEQWRAEPPTPATDQYALGVVIYTMLTGQVPFEAPTPFGLMHRHLNDMATPPHTLRRDISEDISRVVDRAMAKRPVDRFPSVMEFARAFEQVARSEAVTPAARPAPQPEYDGETDVIRSGGAAVIPEARPAPQPYDGATDYESPGGAAPSEPTPPTAPLSPPTARPRREVTLPPHGEGYTRMEPVGKAHGKKILLGIGAAVVVTVGIVLIGLVALAGRKKETPHTVIGRGSGEIAVASGRDAVNEEIYVMNADGSNPRRLTNNGAYDYDPAWSPDGSQIAFTSGRDAGGAEIYIMSANGSNQRNLTNTSGADRGPAWSPDGSQIAFHSNRDGNEEIYVMNADGSGPRNLTHNSAQDMEPAWSPDGSQIAFTSNRDGNYEIYVMKTDGSSPRRLTTSSVDDGGPVWSPDGSQIALVSWPDGNPDIVVMSADGSNQRNLTHNVANDSSPAWLPDGSQIAFVSDRDGNYEIYVMNADGSSPRRLTNSAASYAGPVWRP